jgi:hypothetical protein
MMQDYPKLLSDGAAVGFTQFQRWTAFSAVKNSVPDGVAKQSSGNAAEVAATGETDLFNWSHTILKQLGTNINNPTTASFKGIKVDLPPKVIFAPAFGVTQAQIRSKFPHPNQVTIGGDNNSTTLWLEGPDITVQSLNLQSGTLVVKAVNDAHVRIENLTVNNKGWELQELKDDSSVEQKWAIRGFTVAHTEGEVYVFDQPGRYTLSDQTKKEYQTLNWKHDRKL